jgi:hypothetical protein
MKRELQQRINALGPVVEQMIELLVERLEGGQRLYGEWKEDDARDYLQEALEEALDGQAYIAALLLKIKGGNK